jgi:hypothetical protein
VAQLFRDQWDSHIAISGTPISACPLPTGLSASI